MKPNARPTVPMGEDPNRATILEILKELNKSEEVAPNDTENGLESNEINERLIEFWAIRENRVRLAELLRMLYSNKMIRYDGAPRYSWVRKRNLGGVYQITTEGKEYLRANILASERIQ